MDTITTKSEDSSIGEDWRKNIPLAVRMKVFVRDWSIKYIFNNYDLFRRQKGWADKDLFKHILIQTNYRCTRTCSFCHYGMENPPKNVNMEEDVFYKIIDQLEQINYNGRIGLFEMNEPLTDKRLPKFLRYTREKVPGAWILISTNGDVLNKTKAESLFNDGLNYMYLDSYDEKGLKHNLGIIKDLDIKYQKKIRHMNRVYQTGWGSRGGNLKQFQQDPVKAPCDMPHLIMYIKPSGKVYSCYNDYFDVNEMGDLNKEKLMDVWLGDRFMKLRKELLLSNRDCNSLCKQCDYSGYHSLPNIPISWRIQNALGKNKLNE